MAASELSLAWDPEIDTPATIAIVGGGRAGIEAALYARFLGYDVWLFERGRPGRAWQHVSHVPMSGTWQEETSPLGRAALEAQGTPLEVELASRPTYGEYVQRYLTPLAKTDLVYDSVQIQSTVRSISRCGIPPGAVVSVQEAADLEFRVLVDSVSRGPHCPIVDIVLDCSGLQPVGGLGPGGGWAVGQDRLEPGHLAAQRGTDHASVVGAAAGGRIVLVGNSAAAIRCAELLRDCEGDRIQRWTWLLPGRAGDGQASWAHLPDALAQTASVLVDRAPSEHWAALEIIGVERMTQLETGGWNLELRRRADETVEIQCDDLIVAPPEWPDWQICQPLRESLAEPPDRQADAPFLTPHPHYYVLGSKADRRAQKRLARTLDHIRAVFALIGGRRDLDLYQTIHPRS
ncbi:MAG: NAD(P)/FAD-dependent oxidoreductase [Planctomycetota bacterium]|nr:MAG: NAD(P)/FAD-dependent oxidoreductase [Planctomycetota bacterium]